MIIEEKKVPTASREANCDNSIEHNNCSWNNTNRECNNIKGKINHFH